MNRLTARINWLWRLVMTGFCFVLFGVGGLLLSLVWFNLLLIVQRDRTNRRRLARRSIAASFRFFLTVARGLGVLDYRIHNLDALRNDRGCLVVANHPTLIDYVILASVMPETDCLVKARCCAIRLSAASSARRITSLTAKPSLCWLQASSVWLRATRC